MAHPNWYRAMAAVRHSADPDDWGWALIGESPNLTRAIEIANAHPTRACVTNWSSKIEFENMRPMPAAPASAGDARRV